MPPEPKTRNDTEDFLPLFLKDAPLLDVRAPVEFARGSFPLAVNLPLLDDGEREAVGITYKKEGQAAAISLGHRLVSGDVRAARLEQWVAFARQNPGGYLFCFRGGMRSHVVQEWLREAGVDYPLVKGGYKALRRFLIEAQEDIVRRREFIIISGRTGTGKTILIHQIPRAVDLEGIARHRGSSFGRRLTPQPGQIDFENALAVALLRLAQDTEKPLFIEDESRLVGRCALPLGMLAKMKEWPAVVVEESMESRISAVQRDYVTDMLTEHEAAFGAEGFAKFADFLRESLARIRKRLGPEGHRDILAVMENALSVHRATGDSSPHRQWIEALLTRYYDPMYDYQLSQKKNQIIFSGTRAEVLAWCGKRG
jgi:tRNA 2-selenouridine synthase